MKLSLKALVISSTIVFWGVCGGIWLAAVTATPAVAKDPVRTLTVAEVARHNTKSDCWMIIREQVYDLSAYLPQHPSAPQVLLDWCGKEATQAFDTKQHNRPHSDYAKQLLAKFHLGRLSK